MIRAETLVGIGESLGLPSLSPLAAEAAAQSTESLLRAVVQSALLFQRHTHRTTLTGADINYAMRLANIEPLYGYTSNDPITWRRVSVAAEGANSQQQPHAEDVYYVKERTVKLEDVLNGNLNSSVPDTTFSVHWLAVDGAQPATAANAPLPTNAALKNMFVPQDAERQPAVAKKRKVDSEGEFEDVIPHTNTNAAMAHTLSAEQQLYYEHIVNAISQMEDVAIQRIALRSLRNDNGLQSIVPYLCAHLVSAIHSNLQHTSFLQLCVTAMQTLISNPNVNIEIYLHQLLPSLLTCVLHKRLSTAPYAPHWQLRTFTAAVIQNVVGRFKHVYVQLQAKIVHLYISNLLDSSKAATTHYGCIEGLRTFGARVLKAVLLPYVPEYAIILNAVIDNAKASPVKRMEASYTHFALLQSVSDVLLAEIPHSSHLSTPALQVASKVPSMLLDGNIRMNSAIDRLADSSEHEDDVVESESQHSAVQQIRAAAQSAQKLVSTVKAAASSSIQWNALVEAFGECLLAVTHGDHALQCAENEPALSALNICV